MAKKHCEHCGASMVEYKHGFNKGLARCIYRLATAGGDNVILGGLSLTNSQYSNFPKLRYWDLAINSDADGDPVGKGGAWSLTNKGWLFVRGEIAIPKYAILYRNEVQEFTGDELYITDVTDGWKYRPDYIRESRPHTRGAV